MDRNFLIKNVPDLLKKYKYAILVFAVGLALMLIPFNRNESTGEVTQPVQNVEETALSVQLEQILSQIKGAGKVRVLLSVSAGEKTVYQSDTDISENASRTDTVIITDADRAQNGLIQQVIPPTYLGAIIVCEGADKAEVRLALVEAVSRFTGLGADRISVLKMK